MGGGMWWKICLQVSSSVSPWELRLVLGLGHIRIRPYTPRTNSNAERFIQTPCKEWANTMPSLNSEELKRWLARCLGIYNQHRKHLTVRLLSPQQRLHELLG